jgi:hypothetical protein
MDLAYGAVCSGQLISMAVIVFVGLQAENESTVFQSNWTMPWTFGRGVQQKSA